MKSLLSDVTESRTKSPPRSVSPSRAGSAKKEKVIVYDTSAAM